MMSRKFFDYYTKNLALFFGFIVVVWMVVKSWLRRWDEKRGLSRVDLGPGLKEGRFNPTISRREASVYADRIVDAVNGSFLGFGTDTSLIESIVDSLSPGDLALVHDVFGVRHYDGFAVRDDPMGASTLRNLAFVLSAELGDFDWALRRKISEKYKAIGVPFAP